jgi:hypothetical protein
MADFQEVGAQRESRSRPSSSGGAARCSAAAALPRDGCPLPSPIQPLNHPPPRNPHSPRARRTWKATSRRPTGSTSTSSATATPSATAPASSGASASRAATSQSTSARACWGRGRCRSGAGCGMAGWRLAGGVWRGLGLVLTSHRQPCAAAVGSGRPEAAAARCWQTSPPPIPLIRAAPYILRPPPRSMNAPIMVDAGEETDPLEVRDGGV